PYYLFLSRNKTMCSSSQYCPLYFNDVVVGNDGAKKLYESLGFQTFGIQERSLKYNGQYWDEEHMVLFLDKNK
ncbi:GNAT family N-acetyltransferase, partial [Bacillus sp. D-CC]